jgi:serine/threonine protein kinase
VTSAVVSKRVVVAHLGLYSQILDSHPGKGDLSGSSMDHREHLPVGAELVGDYRIDSVLGHGGFGVTYAATDLALGKTLAIKEYFPTEFAPRDNTLMSTSC